jgi:hypothetical protein
MKRRLPHAKPKRPPKSYRLGAEPGHFQVTGRSAELVLRARKVEKAMTRLPPGALHGRREQAIRRNLSLLTDGEVGGYRFKVKDRKAARQSASKSLKRTLGDLTKKAAGKMIEKMAEQAGGAAWLALVAALKGLVDYLSR